VTADDLRTPYDPETEDEPLSQAARAAVENSLGLPVAVQLVAPPWREDVCLRAMMEVQRLVPFDHTQHARLEPTPRRSPDLGSKPELIHSKEVVDAVMQTVRSSTRRCMLL